MADEQKAQAPPDEASDLVSDRCPNCDGPLKSFWDQPESLCPKCRIFVEILRPRGVSGLSSEPVSEGLHHRLGLAKYHLMSEELDEEELEDEQPKVELEAGPPERYPPAPSVESPRPEVALSEPPGTVPVSASEPPRKEREEPPEPPAAESSDAGIPGEETGETPGESFPEPEVTVEEIPPPPIAMAESAQAAVRAPVTRPPRPRRSHRVVFYAGGVNVAFGGAVLFLGSFLHDFFRVPFIGESYGAFGPLNLFAAQLGAVFVALGLAAMAASARRGRRRSRQAAGG